MKLAPREPMEMYTYVTQDITVSHTRQINSISPTVCDALQLILFRSISHLDRDTLTYNNYLSH